MKRGKFSLSHYKLFSCDMGELIPCGVMEVLPGDTFQHSTSCLLRCAPMLAPVMHPVHVRIHHWFVPFRLIWDEWEEFITGGPDGTSTPEAPHIGFGSGSITQGTLADYLGVGLNPNNGKDVSALPFRAYNLIFNEWYRDQDLVNPITVDVTSGDDTTTGTTLLNCAWEKDYFTSARPWEAKGPAITLPLGTSAPVVLSGVNAQGLIRKASDGSLDAQTGTLNEAAANSGMFQNTGTTSVFYDPAGTLMTDLSDASAVTINTLREALALQRFEEARARYGSRYTEYLRYLGVRSSDARLQRPEYLGGGRQTIQFSEVLQTSGQATPTLDDQLGQLGGHGISAMRSNRYRRFFEEHGLVISLMSVKPKTMYMNGDSRLWQRATKELYWQKELEHIGQQVLWNGEIFSDLDFAQTTGGVGDKYFDLFGYQDRYDEYRRMESSVSGEFRSTLNFWHFARDFSSVPTLNGEFVTSTPTDRTFAVPSTDVLWVMANHSVQARRLVAQVGTSSTF